MLLTNFGLLWPRAGGLKYDFVCEEYFGGKVPPRAARRSDGTVFVPGLNGVYSSASGCDVTRATGSVDGLEVLDVAVVRAVDGSPASPMPVWALSRQPAALHVSLDGGNSFAERHALPLGVQFSRLHVSGDKGVYVAGGETARPLVLVASSDGGQSFVTHSGDPALFGRPATVTDLIGVHPREPTVLLLAAGSPSGGDELWRTNDGGASWVKVLTMQGLEILSGFVWREDGNEVLVAGRELFSSAGQAPAHLYVSRDGGQSFADVIASGASGPRYRCLAADGPRLYACGEASLGEPLMNYSDDGGRTWSPIASLTDIEGSRLCAAGRCLTTAIWLCEDYGTACEGLAGPPERPSGLDAGGMDACAGMDGSCGRQPRAAGCGCALGTPDGRPPIVWSVLGVAVALCLRCNGRRMRSLARRR